MSTTTIELEQEDEHETRRQRDPELRTAEQIVRLLEELDANARRDILDYLTRRFTRCPSVLMNDALDRRIGGLRAPSQSG